MKYVEFLRTFTIAIVTEPCVQEHAGEEAAKGERKAGSAGDVALALGAISTS